VVGAMGDGGAGGGGGMGGLGMGVNGHQALRASHSHAGAFTVQPPAHNGHMALCATSSAPPQFESMAAPSHQGQGFCVVCVIGDG
jgi:hypothetical protein